MAYTVSKLITQAWYLSGIVSRDLDTVEGSQLSDGLDLLNAFLAIKTAQTRLIPYYTSYTLNAVVGQELYFVPNLIQIETLTFNYNVVRFSMIKQSRSQYFGSPRVNNINSLPFNWHIERTLGGTNFYLYFLPSQNFPLNIFGKFSLANVSLNQDLSLTLDAFYIEYLRYGLADYMCSDYGIVFQPTKQKILDSYEAIITDVSPLDLTQNKLSTLNRDHGINWAYVNFPGWTPS